MKKINTILALLVVITIIGLMGCASPLITASRDGDIKAVQLLLDKGVNANEKDAHGAATYGNTALMIAAGSGHTEIVKLLIDRGADVNAKHDHYNRTALMSAARSGHTEIVKLLIDRGADVNVVNKNFNPDGSTALAIAAGEGHTEIVKLLIDRGADVNAQGTRSNWALGWAALIQAAVSDHREIARLLTEKGGRASPLDRNPFLVIPNVWVSIISIDGVVGEYSMTDRGGISISPGTHTLMVKYHYKPIGSPYRAEKGEPILIIFNAKEGKIYVVRNKISEGFFGSTWNAWIDEYP